VRALFLVCFCVFGLFSGALLGAPPILRYVDEIGHLGTAMDPRTSIKLGRALAVPTATGVDIKGRDDTGTGWTVHLAVTGGISDTNVWQADFDRNSRLDLLIGG
jgi:hypothetical protein